MQKNFRVTKYILGLCVNRDSIVIVLMTYILY